MSDSAPVEEDKGKKIDKQEQIPSRMTEMEEEVTAQPIIDSKQNNITTNSKPNDEK